MTFQHLRAVVALREYPGLSPAPMCQLTAFKGEMKPSCDFLCKSTVSISLMLQQEQAKHPYLIVLFVFGRVKESKQTHDLP